VRARGQRRATHEHTVSTVWYTTSSAFRLDGGAPCWIATSTGSAARGTAAGSAREPSVRRALTAHRDVERERRVQSGRTRRARDRWLDLRARDRNLAHGEAVREVRRRDAVDSRAGAQR
jgi:hypothetical protein